MGGSAVRGTPVWWGERTAPLARVLGPVGAVLLLQLVVFPTPFGVWIEGAIFGLLGSLMAIGLALVYRLNKVVNFAQGDLGTAPATMSVGLIAFSGVNYFLGLACGLVFTVLLTLVVEVLVIRRFVRASRIVLTVVTIGLSELLVVVSLIIPRIWGETPIGGAVVNFPWHLSLHLSPVILNQNDLVATVVSLLALAGVALWFKRTDVGIAVRASGDRRDRAAMLGISVNRLQTLTWTVAGLLSFASVFFKAGIVGLPLDPTFSLTALVTALAALALGGFSNLPVVAGSAIALGILEEGVAWDRPTDPNLVLAVVAAVVLASILLRQLVAGRSERESGSGWTLVGGVREMPAALKGLGLVRFGTPACTLAALAAAFSAPQWLGPGTLIDLSSLAILAIVGCSIVVLTGWSGQVSLAQMAFALVGAATGALALADWKVDLSLALLVAAVAGAASAVVVALPTLRLDGIFVAVTTLAFGLAASGYLFNPAEFSWIPSGFLSTVRLFGIPLGSESSVFAVCLGCLVIVLVALHGLRNSRAGRVLRALPSNERAAAAYGVRSARTKLTGFAISGAIAGVAGCLTVLLTQQFEPASYEVPVSLAVFTATAVGGLGSPFGAILGATLVEGSTIFLPPSWQIFPPAFGVLLVLLAFPTGLAGLWSVWRDKALSAIGSFRATSGDGPGPDAVVAVVSG